MSRVQVCGHQSSLQPLLMFPLMTTELAGNTHTSVHASFTHTDNRCRHALVRRLKPVHISVVEQQSSRTAAIRGRQGRRQKKSKPCWAVHFGSMCCR